MEIEYQVVKVNEFNFNVVIQTKNYFNFGDF